MGLEAIWDKPYDCPNWPKLIEPNHKFQDFTTARFQSTFPLCLEVDRSTLKKDHDGTIIGDLGIEEVGECLRLLGREQVWTCAFLVSDSGHAIPGQDHISRPARPDCQAKTTP